MTTVRIIKDWDYPNLMQQTPGKKGVWDNIEFSLGPVEQCDYVIILNRALRDETLYCPPEHVWAIMQEPPNEYYRMMHKGNAAYSRVYTTDIGLRSDYYCNSHPALPWHVNRDYDFLSTCTIPEKRHNLSWVTSGKSIYRGHRERLRFLERIKEELKFDLYGTEFLYIEDKWEALAPYRYSLVVENFRGPYYWTEKLADCFLAWTLPIYYGCTRISEYFPQESIVQMDINDPNATEKIREIVSSDLWRNSLDAIAIARKLILDKYQFFPFVTREIINHEKNGCIGHFPQVVTIPRQLRPPMTIFEKAHQLLRGYLPECIIQMYKKVREGIS